MRLLHRFFVSLLGSAVVRQKSLVRGATLLRIYLDEKGSPVAQNLSEPICTTLVQEAYRRAADAEADKVARYGKFYRQIDAIANEVIAAMDKSPSADPRIKSILEFNKLI
jgi:hypothetical protein